MTMILKDIALDSPLASINTRICHSASHVLAQAVLERFPDAKLGIGPTIETGFYYDFDLNQTLTDEDLVDLEQRMARIIAEKQVFVRTDVARAEAESRVADQPYKQEIIADLNLDTYSFYQNGPFIDLCRGPHVENTQAIKAFKLLRVSGAYWRGSETRPMLQRIYGTAFANPKDLRAYLKQLEEAKKRDHRLLGKQLDLFSIQDAVGGGLVLWHPNGATIRDIIETTWKRQHRAQGYDLVYSPHIGVNSLWQTSGHLDFYEANMFGSIENDNQTYRLKPMNCPFHSLIYKARHWSYRDLPVRYAELGSVYRHERSGVLHGLMRVRGFTQDDAHILCRDDQVDAEIEAALSFSVSVLRQFGFESFELFLSTKPSEKCIGDDAHWQLAEAALRRAIQDSGLPYSVDDGGGAFYGPKIDIKIKDSIGRSWQCSTIQFDFNLPEKFDLTYIGSDGKKHRPIMIHRALLGSLERFFGILIEHYNGAFPLWLAPTQVDILTVAPSVVAYAHTVAHALTQWGWRVSIKAEHEKIGKKIRESVHQKVPYALIIGEQEVANATATLRHRTDGDCGALSLSGIHDALSAVVHE